MAGNSARKARTIQNTPPATSDMCRPEIERIWASPDICRLLLTSLGIEAALTGDQGFGKGGNGSLQVLADAAADVLTQIVQGACEPQGGG